MAMLQKIVPHLWFEEKIEEAVNFYIDLFPNSRINSISYYGDAGPGPKGSVLTMDFELEGQNFVAINGGPYAKFNAAVSFLVHCDTQDEIDRLYGRLLEGGGQEQQCGWLADRFGVVWQVNYRRIPEILTDPDAERTNRVVQAMLSMKKVDIAALEKAYQG